MRIDSERLILAVLIVIAWGIILVGFGFLTIMGIIYFGGVIGVFIFIFCVVVWFVYERLDT